MVEKGVDTKKTWDDKGNELLGAFEDGCNPERTQIYSTRIDIKAAFAERTKRSLKLFYRYMLDHGHQ